MNPLFIVLLSVIGSAYCRVSLMFITIVQLVDVHFFLPLIVDTTLFSYVLYMGDAFGFLHGFHVVVWFSIFSPVNVCFALSVTCWLCLVFLVLHFNSKVPD